MLRTSSRCLSKAVVTGFTTTVTVSIDCRLSAVSLSFGCIKAVIALFFFVIRWLLLTCTLSAVQKKICTCHVWHWLLRTSWSLDDAALVSDNPDYVAFRVLTILLTFWPISNVGTGRLCLILGSELGRARDYLSISTALTLSGFLSVNVMRCLCKHHHSGMDMRGVAYYLRPCRLYSTITRRWHFGRVCVVSRIA